MTLVIHHRRSRLCGQALVEGLVAMTVLLVLYMAISWLGRFQDMALQTSHASRFVAFSLARNETLHPIEQVRRHNFSGPSHQWARSDGSLVLGEHQTEVSIGIPFGQQLQAPALPGGSDPAASAIRHDLKLDGPGIRKAFVSLRFSAKADEIPTTADSSATTSSGALWTYPSLTRQTAILIDAGHAFTDVDAHRRVAGSNAGWRDIVDDSYALGNRISSHMSAVDAAWEREAPQFDWLGPWAGQVPEHHLRRRADSQ